MKKKKARKAAPLDDSRRRVRKDTHKVYKLMSQQFAL